MQRLEVSGAVRPKYGSLGVKRLMRTFHSERLSLPWLIKTWSRAWNQRLSYIGHTVQLSCCRLCLLSAVSRKETWGNRKRSGGKREYGNAVTSCQHWVMKMHFASSGILAAQRKICTVQKIEAFAD